MSGCAGAGAGANLNHVKVAWLFDGLIGLDWLSLRVSAACLGWR